MLSDCMEVEGAKAGWLDSASASAFMTLAEGAEFLTDEAIDFISQALADDLLGFCLENCALVRPFWEEHRTSEHISSLRPDILIMLAYHGINLRRADNMEQNIHVFSKCTMGMTLECKKEDFADFVGPYVDMEFTGVSEVKDKVDKLSEMLRWHLDHWLTHECGFFLPSLSFIISLLMSFISVMDYMPPLLDMQTCKKQDHKEYKRDSKDNIQVRGRTTRKEGLEGNARDNMQLFKKREEAQQEKEK